MQKSICVIKRSGEKEAFQPSKIKRILKWATEGIKDINFEQITQHFEFNYTADGITTENIHKSLIDSCLDLISEDFPDYQIVAGRLLNYALRKKVWGGINPPRLIDLIKSNIKLGYYDAKILEKFSVKEINKINEFIDHDRDLNFTHSGIRQLIDKYLVQDRETKEVFETPQFVYILVAMTLFSDENVDRLSWIKKAYDYFSSFKINLATPVIAGARTPLRSFASCALFSVGDSLSSIGAHDYLFKKASASRYGLGFNISKIRPLNAKIRQGDVLHTGLVPYLKSFESGIKSCHQNGIRGASGTVFINWWHQQVDDVLVLKNNALPDEKAVRFLDYCLNFSNLFIDRIKSKANITLFNPNEVPELVENFGKPEWNEMYIARENDPSVTKRVIPAMDLMRTYAKERLATGRIYSLNVDNINSQAPYNNSVTQSNLCVAPETLILTKNGHKIISESEGEEVEIWNGKCWSNVTIVKTGENQKLVTVNLSDGKSLDCTPYHTWYTVKSYNDQYNNILTKKKTHELKDGDKLIKFDTPIINGNELFPCPYTHGAFCGDGTYEKSGRTKIALYGEKDKLLKKFDCFFKNLGRDSSGRLNIIILSNIRPKFDVPLMSSVETKLRWLEGYLDTDGTIARNGDNESIQVASIEIEFLKNVQLLLQTLGVNSKIVDSAPERESLLPDGRGGYKLYSCKEAKRLLITSNGLYKLSVLGFKPVRLKFKRRLPQRDASQFVTVLSVVDKGRYDDTFCVNEPIEHKAVFNGILTGNCMEITQPTSSSEKWNDENGLIGVCILSAINALNVSDEEFEDVCAVAVRMLDNLIDYQSYFDLSAENFAKKYRSLGIGALNFAAYLADKKTKYDDDIAPMIAAQFAEKVSYYTIKASIQLAKERGVFEFFDKTKWKDGSLPIDRYNKNVDKFVDPALQLDWESLRKDLLQYGIRNSTLTAYMPVESSSVISGSTSGLEPIRDYIVSKTSKAGSVIVVAPKIKENRQYYTLAFDLRDTSTMAKIYAAINKFTCMSISANTYLNTAHYENREIPLSTIVFDTLNFFEMGGKTQYYCNTEDGAGSEENYSEEFGCSSGACTL